MENKQYNRQSSVPPKGPANDGRKDHGSNQKHQRNQRRRDPAPRPRNEPASGRKPTPQRSREFDKRPRSRGYFNDKHRQEVTEVRRAEPGSALRSGSKKGNLNHLLNFTFASRDSDGFGYSGGRASGAVGWKGKNKWSGKSSVKYTKEQFLQANCQFVVKEKSDYSAHAADPDTLVDWGQIEQVRILSHEVPSCPICLYPPTAAKITRCGHIYCWACILHYLSLDDKSWSRCPICYESIHRNDLKSVMALETHQYISEQQITMKLMKRKRGSTYIMPKVQWTERDGKPHNVDDDVDVRYAKLLVANDDQAKKIVDAEKRELEQQMKEEGDSLEGSFVQAALQLLLEREKTLSLSMDVKKEVAKVIGQSDSTSSGESSDNSGEDEATKPWKNEDVVEYADAFTDEVGGSDEAPSKDEDDIFDSNPIEKLEEAEKSKDASAEEIFPASRKSEDESEISVEEAADQLEIPVEVEKRLPNQRTETYYYYQSEDGQQIYLHSLNVRCMLKEYGSWEACPETITATIVEMEGITMTEELRNRLRYLSHLPITCQFQVAELNLQPPTVSSQTLSFFRDDIEKRRKLRQRRMREERQRSRKIQIAENKKIGIYPGMRVNISSQRHFPGAASSPPNTEITAIDQRTLSPTGSTESSTNTPFGSPPATADFAPGSPISVGSSDDGQQSGSMSFAQMLRAGKARPQVDTWPKVKKSEESRSMPKENKDSDDSDSENQAFVPVFQSSFGDAIEQALSNFKKSDVDGKEAVPNSSSKKKKGKKKLLFTTTMHRN